MKRLTLLMICAVWCFMAAAGSRYSVYNLTCEQIDRPVGIDTPEPHFSWQLHAEERAVMQAAYQIIVADSENKLTEERANVWNSGKTESDRSVMVAFAGSGLKSATTYYWRIRSWNTKGICSEWSEPATFTTGLFSPADWGKARWIAMERDGRTIVPAIHQPLVNKELKDEKTGMYRMPQFRKVVPVKKKVRQALAFVTGLGQFELMLNGKKVGDHFLDPGWTKYDKEAMYVAFDVTDCLHEGRNVIGVMLGNGFYNIPRERYFKLLGSFGAPKMRMRLVIRYDDGKEEEVVSDKSWRVTESPITYSSIYGGEDYNATLLQNGWADDASFDDSRWQKAIETTQDIKLRAQIGTELKVRETVPVVTRYINGKGQWVYDLGQNFAGIIRVRLRSGKSMPVVFRPAELQNADRTVNQSATGKPFYFGYTTLGDGSVEQWQPQFSYYGFRYVQVEGAVPAGEKNPDGLPEIMEIEGLHTCSAAAEAGSFSCSNPMFNRIYNLIDWAIRSNMASVLTDCPHREKLGWQEQNHLMQYSMQYRYRMGNIYAKIMNDMEASQLDNGAIPTIAPEYVRFADGFEDTPEWGSAFIICPWYIYKWYGDTRLIAGHYPAMRKYMDYLASRSDNHIVAYGLGDWFDIGPKRPGYAQLTANGLTATAIYYYNATLMGRMAALIGETADAQRYTALAADIKKAYNDTFFNKADSTYDRNSQTASAMSLFMGLVEPEYEAKVAENLIKDITGRGYALTAGDIGYRYVLRTLESKGRQDVIFRMNSKYDVPGYGWQLAHGATALTESWQAYGFVSNNHLMLGHLMEWLFGGLGGIRQSEGSTAFRETVIDPQAVGDVTEATTGYDSPYGRIACQWKKTADKYTLRVEIPANSRATVCLPSDDESRITEYGTPISRQAGVVAVEKKDGKSKWSVGSGTYLFEVTLK